MITFTEKQRLPYETVVECDQYPAWIVHYSDIEKPYFQAYVVKEYCLPLKKGKETWAHDNKRIGKDGKGFKTLDEAKQAIIDYFGE